MDDARDGEVVRRKPRQHLDSLTAPEREAFLKPLLPAARPEACDEDDNNNNNNNNNDDDDDDDDADAGSEPSPPFAGHEQQLRRPRRARAGQARTFLKTQFYLLVYTVVHTLFALYLRLRRAYHAVADGVFSVLYYHHRTPELIQRDVKRLGRLPEHLSVIVTLKHTAHGGGVGGHAAAGTALEQLMDEVAEIAAWCACAGIPALSVYEKTGVLKSYMSTLHHVVSAKLHAYCGRQRPSLQLRAPHVHPYMNGDTFDGEDAPYSSNGALCLVFFFFFALS
jgi:dehydrodolichyl diphosphate syntase complex subunit NUS1